MTPGYRAAWWAARLLLWGIFGFRVAGAENCPRGGPIVVAANHRSWLDPVVLGAALPRQATFIGAEDLLGERVSPGFVPWQVLLRVTAPLVRWFGMIPVRRTEVDPGAYTGSALRAAMRVLRGGGVLAVFAEGGVNRTGEALAPLKPGAVLLSRRARAPILPAWIFGTDRALPLGEVIPHLVPVGVRFGAPLAPPGDPSEAELYAALGRLREALLRLHLQGPP
ncbi:MAG: lysophospholipid acyltransferase family protein [Armatimonadota bacterium]|nr:lysophospholipid acyltransferase family protein [Armatimonadota bacterium]MDR7563996.1 lysophospholipid acyltransferase family protein [Armatimonadota bacterium]MDR7602104.1 lysophospholipid acyltransferase family protein [Armatimonadota bacterium]